MSRSALCYVSSKTCSTNPIACDLHRPHTQYDTLSPKLIHHPSATTACHHPLYVAVSKEYLTKRKYFIRYLKTFIRSQLLNSTQLKFIKNCSLKVRLKEHRTYQYYKKHQITHSKTKPRNKHKKTQKNTVVKSDNFWLHRL